MDRQTLLAQINTIILDPPVNSGFTNLKDLGPELIVSRLIGLVLVVAGIVFFFILVLGGVKWIMSGGDKGHTEAARNQITAALVGLVIVFAAWAITKLIEGLFGVNILRLNFNIS